MRLTSIRRRRRRRRRWRQRPEIFRRRWSVATPVGLHPSYVATDHRRFLTTNPGGTPLIIRGKLFRQPRPALLTSESDVWVSSVGASHKQLMEGQKEGFVFDEKKHLYFYDGKPMTGCTTILGILAKP